MRRQCFYWLDVHDSRTFVHDFSSTKENVRIFRVDAVPELG
ncbi:hypothetical protein [Arcanobacterium bovis]|nr:hypothetical protein [Arcanobacterium bovis]